MILQYGYDMPIPMRDFVISETGIEATLSFGRSPTWTFVPWSAVFAISDEEQHSQIWENDIPADADFGQGAPLQQQAAPPNTEKKPRPTYLKLVK